MKCEWDPAKAASNLRKHGVSFEEAATALADDHSLTGADPEHSVGESRFVTFACPAPDDSWSFPTQRTVTC
jgi:uncharacterized protein